MECLEIILYITGAPILPCYSDLKLFMQMMLVNYGIVKSNTDKE